MTEPLTPDSGEASAGTGGDQRHSPCPADFPPSLGGGGFGRKQSFTKSAGPSSDPSRSGGGHCSGLANSHQSDPTAVKNRGAKPGKWGRRAWERDQGSVAAPKLRADQRNP